MAGVRLGVLVIMLYPGVLRLVTAWRLGHGEFILLALEVPGQPPLEAGGLAAQLPRPAPLF